MICLILCLALFISVLALECWKEYLNQTKLKAFVFERGLPVFGYALEFMKCDAENIFDFPHKLIGNRIGKIFYSWMGSILFMFTYSPEVYEAILNSEKLLKKAYLYDFIRNKGIFAVEPSIWKPQRRALFPTFSVKMVNSFVTVFNEKSKRMVDLMECNIGQTIDMHRIAFNQSLDIFMDTGFGVNLPMQNETGDQFRKNILGIFDNVQLRMHSVWMKWDFLFQFTNYYKTENILYPRFHRFMWTILETKRMFLAEKLIDGIDELADAKQANNMNFLQKCLQLEKEHKFDANTVREQMETFLIGGVDSSATTIQCLILMLAIHPEYQERVMDELRSIFSDVDEPITNEHLSQMKFTELNIKETLRLFPIAPFLARECTEDFPIMGGIIPKGAQIILNLLKTHRNPEYWGENANEFYPERFLPENSANFHPYQFIPFSSGLRNCMGIRYAYHSMKITMAYLLRRYKFTTNLKMHEVKVRAGLFIKVVNENPVQIERREW